MKLNFDLKKVPPFNVPDAPLASASQSIVPIAEILDDIILYKDGGASIVFESTSLNFGLLSEKEQEAVIAAYSALLNSLSFAIQIVVRSEKKDISVYLKYLDREFAKISNEKLKNLAQNYKSFIAETIKKKNVLGKRFFVVIPFSPLELGVKQSFMAVTKRSQILPFPKSYVIKKARTTLYPRRDHLIRQSGRLGLKMKVLTKEKLIEVFYNSLNPNPPVLKKDEK